jgi:hypothetical protein
MSESAGEQTFAFTHDSYRELLGALKREGYEFRTFYGPTERDTVLLRHDVDLSVVSALRMAQIEANMGIESTYHFLLTSPLYNPFERATRERIEKIDELGHEVALHFSTHAYWSDGEPEESMLRTRVESELAALGTLLGRDMPPTVSFHIPPDWVLDREIAGLRSTYAPRYFSEIGYVADSGQRWRDDPPSADSLPERTQLLVHPGLWGPSDEGFEGRIDRAIESATSHTREHAQAEFIEGVRS